jgi:PAS domain-containing protein
MSVLRPQVLNAIADAAIFLSPDLRVSAANSTARTLLGWTNPDEAIGLPALGFVLPEDIPRITDAILRSRRAHQGYVALEASLLTGPATWWRTELRVAALLDEDGALEGFLITAPQSASHSRGVSALKVISEAAPQADGEDLLLGLVRQLAQAMGTRYALVGSLQGSPATGVTTLATWIDGAPGPILSYQLAGTPCARLAGQEVCHIPERVQALFPHDSALRDMNIEGYLGAVVVDSNQSPIGVLAVMDDQPLYRPQDLFTVLRVCAARAGAEIERRLESRRQSQLLRQLTEMAGVAGWVYDAHEDELAVVGDSLRSSGVTEAEIATMVRAPELLLAPAEAAGVRHALQPGGTPGAGWDLTYEHRLPSGATVWRRSRARVAMEGATPRIYGVVHAISPPASGRQGGRGEAS